MATLILPYPAFTAGTPAVAAEVQDNFTTIRDHINGQNIGTANIETTLVSRVGGPILFLNQASQEQIALSILNSRTKSALQITQSAVLGAGSSIIAIDDNATQTTGDAQLYINTQVGSTIPAIKVNHGSDVTMSLTKTQLDLFNSAVEVSAARVKLPVRSTAERDVITQEGSILYNSLEKSVQYRNSIGWNDITPVGVIQMYAGTVAPVGWLICDGSEISQTTYATLFGIIGTTFNTGGEGASNFRLPDFKRRTAVGAGGTGTGVLGNAVGDTGGAETHTLITSEMPTHTHGYTDATIPELPGVLVGLAHDGNGTTAEYPKVTGGTTLSAGSDAAHNNMQPSLVVNYIIKY